MYAELVASLTVNDRKALAERGVPNARVSEWRTGLRLPTRPQTIALAAVKNVDVMALEAELMAIETQKEAAKKPEMKGLLEGLHILNAVTSQTPSAPGVRIYARHPADRLQTPPKYPQAHAVGKRRNATYRR